jgi:threonyl-tRNA synthetase
MIHRAILGSLERFIGILTEHFGGEFPLWLAPVQVAVIAVTPLTDVILAYAKKVQQKLHDAGLRSEIDLSEENISAKIRARELQKIPYMAIVGARESADGTVAVREHKKGSRGGVVLDEFVSNLRRDVAAKSAL